MTPKAFDKPVILDKPVEVHHQRPQLIGDGLGVTRLLLKLDKRHLWLQKPAATVVAEKTSP